MIVRTPILGSTYVARSVNAADSRMVNLFPEIIPEGGKEPAFLQRAPGLRLLATLGTGPVRGLWSFGGFGYAVSGTTLYRVAPNWTSTVLGTVPGTGPVSMSDNGTQLFVAANGPSFIYNAGTGVFQQITDPDFPGAAMVSYLDGYFVFTEPNSQKVWVTDLLEGTQVDPLDFASAEGSPDGLVSVIASNRELWLFGTTSAEVWYNAGTADFPLQRIQGAFNEVGCAAAFSVAKMDNSVFWLAADGRGQGMVYRSNGYQAVRISTHAVEWQIQQYGNLADAIAYTYQQDGHSFYVLTFPTAETTWVYDVATQAWHERASWDGRVFSRHRSNCQMAFASEIVVGDFENGNIYAFDLDVYSDAGGVQRWLRSWRALPTGLDTSRRMAHHYLQLDCETGVGLSTPPNPTDLADSMVTVGLLETQNENLILTETTDQNIEVTASYLASMTPKVMLRWSDDGGHTWSNEYWRSMGRIGQFSRRTIWRRLGMTFDLHDRVYEVSGTDPVKIAITGATLDMSVANA